MSMERVKEIEECIEWAKNHLVNPPANLETEDIQFLIDEYKRLQGAVKQQSEQIEELEQANARGNGHVKACEEKITQLEGQLNTKNALYLSASRDRDKLYNVADRYEKALQAIADTKGKTYSYVDYGGQEVGVHIKRLWEYAKQALNK